ncbi:hypothetical protein NP233_g9605 [Leucocoprinus birnbaumii]|uniref:Uncharacterized protein n=1 Tax=Leucocoprinus birnbaumii TaxID=56174 RepID=A0AAD5VNM4_9AGAR|nr:hypothetical protein NP233_g9605 [Leucocoprinus birnbaumii]
METTAIPNSSHDLPVPSSLVEDQITEFKITKNLKVENVVYITAALEYWSVPTAATGKTAYILDLRDNPPECLKDGSKRMDSFIRHECQDSLTGAVNNEEVDVLILDDKISRAESPGYVPRNDALMGCRDTVPGWRYSAQGFSFSFGTDSSFAFCHYTSTTYLVSDTDYKSEPASLRNWQMCWSLNG